VDPRRLLDGFGLELTTALLTARTEHGGRSAKALVDLAAWIASLMDRPLR